MRLVAVVTALNQIVSDLDLHIALSIPFVMLSLFGLSKCVVALNKQMKSEEKESKPSKKNFSGNFKITDYVVSVLLSQGGESNKT